MKDKTESSIRCRIEPETFERLKILGEKSNLSVHQYAKELIIRGLDYPDLELFMTQQQVLSEILLEIQENQRHAFVFFGRLETAIKNIFLLLIPRKWDFSEEELTAKINQIFGKEKE